jgi:hypothetical protein
MESSGKIPSVGGNGRDIFRKAVTCSIKKTHFCNKITVP